MNVKNPPNKIVKLILREVIFNQKMTKVHRIPCVNGINNDKNSQFTIALKKKRN